MDLQTAGKIAVLLGISLTIVGGLLWVGGKLGLGALPGDVRFEGRGWSCFVPIGASILLSLLLTLALNVVLRWFGK